MTRPNEQEDTVDATIDSLRAALAEARAREEGLREALSRYVHCRHACIECSCTLEAKRALSHPTVGVAVLKAQLAEAREALLCAEEHLSDCCPANGWGLLDHGRDADRKEQLACVRRALASHPSSPEAPKESK